ncbi:MAG: PHP domain-containing protein [Candidatus Omnitrophota bacterium]|jgi:predicted metal-dependent phosphoesterase TrpH|nr:MAG: PHP domain-containing protein [Candidatus Omnitrophota bacterium]
MKYADLHLHTVYSDGSYTPEKLIDEAAKSGLSAISVTEHDSVDSTELVMACSRVHGLEAIAGIEFTAEYNDREIHILGYLVDYKNHSLREKIAVLQQVRTERVHHILKKLGALNIALDPSKVFALATKGTVGRLHIAKALVSEGLVGSTWEVFDKYLGDKGPAYVAGFRFSVYEAARIIKDAGGIPVLAHPHVLENNDLIPYFAEQGVMGIEALYSEYSEETVHFYLQIAQKLNLLVTGGSDFHGDAKPEVKLGSVKIPYTLVEDLKKAKTRL